jgi:molybdopterin converting factor small subunit
MQVRVRLFAGMRERFGADEVVLDGLRVGATVGEVREALDARCPSLRGLPAAGAVNRAYAGPGLGVDDGDEVAFIPPVSGG